MITASAMKELISHIMTSFNPFVHNIDKWPNILKKSCTANQITGFYMKCNTGLKWVK